MGLLFWNITHFKHNLSKIFPKSAAYLLALALLCRLPNHMNTSRWSQYGNLSKQIVVYSEYCVYMQRICFISCSGSTEINRITRYSIYTVKFCCLDHQLFEYFKLEVPATFSLIYFTLNSLNPPDILKVFFRRGSYQVRDSKV